MLAKCTFIIFLCFIVTCINSQPQFQFHLLKYINTNEENVSPRPQYDSIMAESRFENTQNSFANADRLCIKGMWALYNTTLFGEGAEDSTTVISVRGTDIIRCTASGQIPILKSIKSLRYLGAADYSTDGLVIYSQPYLLGAVWNITTLQQLPQGVNGFPLGSLAVTGGKAWLLCGDTDVPCTNGVCINMKNSNLYLQRNTLKDKSIPNGWPRVIRKATVVEPEECSYYPNPPRLTTRKLARRDASAFQEKGNIEIDIWDSSS